jgi:hypothetical protein
MRPLISSPEEQARFIEMARSWQGTAYVADGAVKGTGCSCSSLPYAVHSEFGHTAPPIPRRAGLQKVQILPVMLEWLDGHPEHYQRVEMKDRAIGDIILVDAGIGHLVIVVDREEVLHSWQNRGVHASHISSVLQRLVAIWRPVVSK